MIRDLQEVASTDYAAVILSIPQKLVESDLMRKVKGWSAFKMFREFPNLKKRYWGCHFWGRGYFSTTNGAITEEVVLQYLERHIYNHTGASR